MIKPQSGQIPHSVRSDIIAENSKYFAQGLINNELVSKWQDIPA